MMEEWVSLKIKDLGTVITGNTPPRKQPELYGTHTLFVKATDIAIGSRYCFEPEECYSELGYKKYEKSLIPKGSTCVVTIGSIGEKIIQAHTDMFINQAMNAVIPFDNFDKSFIYYLLELNLPQLKLYDSGTASGRENVSKSSFSNIDVQVPESKLTQKKIALILASYDDLIEMNLKRIKLLEEMMRFTYEEWFLKLKFPGHNSVKVDTESGLPEGWQSKELYQYVDVVKSTVLPESLNKEVKYIGLEHMPRKSIVLSDHGTSDNVISLKNEVKKGDILFGKIRPYFHKVGMVLHDCITSTDNISVRPHPEFAGIVMETMFSASFVDMAVQTSNGTKMPRANWDVIKHHKIIIPSDKMAKKYQTYFANSIDAISILARQNQLLEEARDILLPRLMTGLINVDEIEIPQASEVA